uniref:PIN domain n=1 Tax=Candidatus Kentrum sp. LPFa TaxID=2126335 RepID=A0A450XP84_9GAMM|nr:MAG: PIN domain [Candidatus Kentron sp. LPFa]VFK30948.1 MAG: PIN domain [Candidatus Kentron sp. LPFa]
MRATVYVESSVISYLTSRPSRDVVTAARQAITAQWWDERRDQYEVFISALVEDEIAQGNPKAAERRLALVDDIPALDITNQSNTLAKDLVAQGAAPKNSEEDALHIGIATAAGMDYLLTWNFKHINNVETKAAIAKVVRRHGFTCPVLCSPEELL